MPERKTGIVAMPPRPAMQPAAVEKADVYSLQALIKGEATPDQQRRIVAWLKAATRVGENPYRTGEDGRRDTDFLCGMKFVGDQFKSLTVLNPSLLDMPAP